MEKNSFLDGLKNALDSGEFNSDAAKYITEIHKAAENVDIRETEEKLEKNREAIVNAPVDADEIKKREEEYEEKITKLKRLDSINATLVSIINLEADVNDALTNLKSYIDEIEEDFIGDESEYEELKEKLEKIKKHFKFK